MRSDVARARGRARGRLGAAGLALALAVAVAGCGGGHTGSGSGSGSSGSSGAAGASGAHGGDAVAVTDPVSRYGYGPTPDPHITYQPDVVMIGGGPNAIRSGSSDGLTWTLDGSAKGVADLAPGKVMFASAKATGRVVAVQHVGSDVAVTVAPVTLTDVVKDGHLTLDQPLDLGGMLYQQIPDEPGAYTDLKTATSDPSTDPSGDAPTDGSDTPTDSPSDTPSDTSTDAPTDAPSDAPSDTSTDAPSDAPSDSPSDTSTEAPSDTSTDTATTDTDTSTGSDTATDAAAADGTRVITLPPLDLAAAVAAAGQLPPPGPSYKKNPGDAVSVSVGNFEVSPYRDGKNLGFTAAYSGGPGGGLKLSFSFGLDMSQAAVHADVPISNGQIGPTAQMWISGIKALNVKIQAGSANGLSDNQKARIQLPIDLGSELVPIYGIPTTMALKMTFVADTAFSAKNSTITASASIPMNGGNMGFNGSQGSAPGVSSGTGLINSLSGASVGINGIVLAVNFRASWGLGFAAAMAGPYASLTFSTGMTVGSDVGMLKCKSVTEKVTVSGGVGLSVSSGAVGAITSAITKAVGTTGSTALGNSLKLGASKDLASVTALDRTDYLPNVNGCKPQ